MSRPAPGGHALLGRVASEPAVGAVERQLSRHPRSSYVMRPRPRAVSASATPAWASLDAGRRAGGR
ncbi:MULTISPECIES: hypothetical protein [Micromonospora]|uniref:hypothetical protein n=1 Tax=Micromonospora TaxID=1873 RepID=UPI0011AF9609|nr:MULTISPECIES: hypothetical protein [Micromonospora]